MKQLCIHVDMLDCWNNLQPLQIRLVQSRLMAMFEDVSRDMIGMKPKLQTYKMLKDQFGAENYVKANLNKCKRSLICQTRLGILPISLETGRFQNCPVCECLCPLCKSGVEDECHFVLNCEELADVRRKSLDVSKTFNELTDDVTKLKLLCQMPYSFGNLIQTLWFEQEKLLAKNAM